MCQQRQQREQQRRQHQCRPQRRVTLWIATAVSVLVQQSVMLVIGRRWTPTSPPTSVVGVVTATANTIVAALTCPPFSSIKNSRTCHRHRRGCDDDADDGNHDAWSAWSLCRWRSSSRGRSMPRQRSQLHHHPATTTDRAFGTHHLRQWKSDGYVSTLYAAAAAAGTSSYSFFPTERGDDNYNDSNNNSENENESDCLSTDSSVTTSSPPTSTTPASAATPTRADLNLRQQPRDDPSNSNSNGITSNSSSSSTNRQHLVSNLQAVLDRWVIHRSAAGEQRAWRIYHQIMSLPPPLHLHDDESDLNYDHDVVMQRARRMMQRVGFLTSEHESSLSSSSSLPRTNLAIPEWQRLHHRRDHTNYPSNTTNDSDVERRRDEMQQRQQWETSWRLRQQTPTTTAAPQQQQQQQQQQHHEQQTQQDDSAVSNPTAIAAEAAPVGRSTLSTRAMGNKTNLFMDADTEVRLVNKDYQTPSNNLSVMEAISKEKQDMEKVLGGTKGVGKVTPRSKSNGTNISRKETSALARKSDVVASQVDEDTVGNAAMTKVSQLVARAGSASASSSSSSAFDGAAMGIGGLDDVLQQIRRRVWIPLAAPPSLLRELGIQPVRGLLLYGKPGCGKTLLARKLGQILSPLRPITVVSGPEIMDKFVGSSEKNLRVIFDNPPDIYDTYRLGEIDGGKAMAKAALHVIVMDEFDAIARSRGGRGGAGGDQGDAGVARDSVVNQLLAKMDGIDPLVVPTLVIGLTNKRSLIEPALLRPGRLEVQIEVPPPRTVQQRVSILQVHTRDMHQAGRLLVSDAPQNSPAERRRQQQRQHPSILADSLLSYHDFLHQLAIECDGFSGASLAGVARAAASHALERAVEDFSLHVDDQSLLDDCIVTMDDFRSAIQDVLESLGNSDWDEEPEPSSAVITEAKGSSGNTES